MKKLILFLALFWSITVIAQTSPVASKQFGTVADLRLQGGVQGVQVLVQGQNTVTDGNGGVYAWNDASTVSDDGLTVVKVSTITTGRWLRMPNSNTIKGSAVFNGELLKTAYVVNHGLGFVPAQVYVQPTSAGAAVISWISNKTATTFTVNFLNVLNVGVNNITFDFLIIKF